jgi:hypothetical protein
VDILFYRFWFTQGWEVGYTWGSEKKNACKNNCGRIRKGIDMEPKNLADLWRDQAISLTGFLNDKCVSGSLTGSISTYSKSYWDWGIKAAYNYTVMGTLKQWIPVCCKCAHLFAQLTIGVKAKARVGLQVFALAALGIIWAIVYFAALAAFLRALVALKGVWAEVQAVLGWVLRRWAQI